MFLLYNKSLLLFSCIDAGGFFSQIYSLYFSKPIFVLHTFSFYFILYLSIHISHYFASTVLFTSVFILSSYTVYFLLSILYPSASCKCFTLIASLSSKSAIVRAVFKILLYPRAVKFITEKACSITFFLLFPTCNTYLKHPLPTLHLLNFLFPYIVFFASL